jgi:hypothetical protein
VARAFVDPAGDGWLQDVPPRIWGRMPFALPEEAPEPGSTPVGGGDVVLRYTDGKAAVVASSLGDGRTLWVSTSIDNGWLGEAVFFRPVLLEEAAQWLTRPRHAARMLEVGGRLRARIPRLATQVRLTAPGGRQVAPTPREGPEEQAFVEVVHDALGVAGAWTLTYETRGPDGEARNVQEPFAVGVAPAEGALSVLRSDALRGAFPRELDLEIVQAVGGTTAAVEDVRRGEITRPLLFALLALLLIEPVLAVLFGRARVAVPTRDDAGGGA